MSNLATIFTSEGDIIIELDMVNTPEHAKNFIKLVNNKFYDDMFFHRTEPNFLIQIGDPNTKPNVKQFHNDVGYTIPPEIKPNIKHLRGSINAARQDDIYNPNRESSGSQFCIFVSDSPHLDNKYTVFGKVIKGLEVADKILLKPTDEKSFPKEPVRVTILMGTQECSI